MQSLVKLLEWILRSRGKINIKKFTQRDGQTDERLIKGYYENLTNKQKHLFTCLWQIQNTTIM